MQIRVGCTGLAGLSLSKYAELFDTIEINSTFYKLPKKETAERWFESTKGRIVFCIKAFQGITHPVTSPTWKRAGTQKPQSNVENYGHLKPTKQNVETWNKTLRICKALRADVCVIQLPPSFTCTNTAVNDALKFFKMTCRNVSIAVEFRHKCWIENVARTKTLIKNAMLIHITRPLKEMPLSNKPICYYRLHGLGTQLYKYNYTDDDLQKLKKVFFEVKCSNADVMFNNLAMRDDALRFKEIIMK
ncbi:MAG: DUF72 domain-containing protein [Nitrososphaerales archaeon]